jgi:hypothetical protein
MAKSVSQTFYTAWGEKGFKVFDLIFSLNSPCISIILDIHQQDAQINKGAN